MHIDYETFSPVDLVKCGLYRYAEEAEIILCTYAIDDGPEIQVDLLAGEAFPQEFLDGLRDPDTIKWAQNAQFERVITKFCLRIDVPPEQWRCTQVWASGIGLPGKLEMLSQILHLKDEGKLKSGKALIRKFCVPRKPTKKILRTRNMPGDYPEDWEEFKRYNVRDVVAERAVHRRLQPYPLLESEWCTWFLDQKINDRGIRIDLRLVRNAISLAEGIRNRLMERAKEITQLANPNSRKQILDWLADEGVYAHNLTKATVAGLLGTTDNDKVEELLAIRQRMAKTSVSKFDAIARSVSSDGRLRGTLKFNGAGRTCRWAGQILQPQNLPSKLKISDVPTARDIVHYTPDLLEILYENVSEALVGLIRPTILPDEGDSLIVADFSAIEARILAWVAQEQWRLDLFAAGGKLYEESAAKMFKVPIENIKKGRPEWALRAKGKVTELACFTRDTQILTSNGVKAIVDVLLTDKVWDGIEWVEHKGVVPQGLQRVLKLDGVETTPNQLINLNDSWLEANLLASSASTLSQALATGSANLPSLKYLQEVAGQESAPGVRVGRKWQRLLLAIFERAEARAVIAVRKLKRAAPALSFTLNMLMPCRTLSTVGDLSTDYGPPLRDAPHLITNSTQTMAGAGLQSVKNGDRTLALFYSMLKLLRVGTTRLLKWIGWMSIKGTRRVTSASLREKLTSLTNARSTTLKPGSGILKNVYDIAFAGPRNRFTIVTDSGHLLVHNCGYQGWEGALITMGALDMGLQLDELAPLAQAWREANPAIVQFWKDCERAAIKAVKTKTSVQVGSVTFEADKYFMWIVLPSGRKLMYVSPKVGTNDRGNLAVAVEGINGETKQWGRTWLYGGLITENICQAIARDCLAYCLCRVADTAWNKTLLHVHDELLVSVPKHSAVQALADIEQVMGQPIPWAPGLLLKGDGFITDFYIKGD